MLGDFLKADNFSFYEMERGIRKNNWKGKGELKTPHLVSENDL